MFPQPVVPFIREAGVSVRPPWRTPNRRLLDYLLLSVDEGECEVEADGARCSLRPGEICLIQPDTLHALRGITATITPYLHIDVYFNPCREQGFPTKGGQVDLVPFRHLQQPRLDGLGWLPVPIKLDLAHPLEFRSTLNRAIQLWLEATPISRLEADHLAGELLLKIIKRYNQQAMAASRPRHPLDWVPAYLAAHLAEPLSVADLAQRAALSPSRVSALFRARFGLPPHQYLLRARVEYAQELLRGTTLPVRDIAESCGFADIPHFSRTFKRLTGATPGAFRGEQALRA